MAPAPIAMGREPFLTNWQGGATTAPREQVQQAIIIIKDRSTNDFFGFSSVSHVLFATV